jgi:DNA polymerase-1
MMKGRKETEDKIKQLEKELHDIVGWGLNYNSPKQCQRYFYNEKKITPYKKKTAAGYTITCDSDALIRIGRGTATRKGLEEAFLIMELRTLTSKTLGTYLNLDKIDKDGRYRSSYNPVGARTGRLSSSENIFGTGGNQQNWPHEHLKYLVADPGYIAYSFDLSQAENRIVAYVARILEMVEAFETGMDVHSLTAALMFGKRPDEISDVDGSSSLAGGRHSERFWGKKANHSLNYGIGYSEFALKNEVPEFEAKQIINAYHKAYPGVRGNYHALVQNQLANGRTITNLFGRKRVFLDRWGNQLFKDAYAQIPQSTVGDKINEHGINYVYYNPTSFKELELLRQVHDDFGFQIPIHIGWEEHSRMLWRIKEKLETPLSYHDREFIIPADLTMGLSFSKEKDRCVEVKSSKWPKSLNELALLLKDSYEKLTRKEN